MMPLRVSFGPRLFQRLISGPLLSNAGRITAAAGLVLIALGPASADDWLQFRHDPQRTGASRDRVKLPLTDIWDQPGGTAPVIWRGRLFVVRDGGMHRVLRCLDARTGEILWQQSLGLKLDSPFGDYQSDPVVSENGLLYLFDLDRNRPIIRALDASTGRNIAVGSQGTRVRIGVRHPGLPPIGSAPAGPAALDDFGFPLLVGNELMAFSMGFDAIRWGPGAPLQLFSLFHAPLLPGEAPFPAQLYRNVPALVSSGVVVTGAWPFAQHPRLDRVDGTNFVAVMDPGGEVRWHRDIAWMPGVPVVGSGTVFVPTTGGLAALDPNGNTRWSTIREGLPSNPPRPGIGHNRRLVREQLVVAQQRVFNGRCTAWEQGTGEIVWDHSQLSSSLGGSLAATPDYLMVSGTGRLAAVRLRDGKIVWMARFPVGREREEIELALSGGLVFMGGAKTLRTMAPAERTFHVAIDNPNRSQYRLHPPPEENFGEVEGAPAPEIPPASPESEKPGTDAEQPDGTEKPPAGAEKPPAPPGWADSTLLRLRWEGAPEELVRRARDRRTQVPGIPLTLVLDWLDAKRATGVGLPPEGWTDAQIRRYAGLCRELAEASRPGYFDVAPDINVYLLRQPTQRERIRAMLRVVHKAVAEVSPETRVCASFNAEVLTGYYGQGSYLPFGALPLPERRRDSTKQMRQMVQAMQAEAAELAREVDAMGLTTCPQAGFPLAREMPGSYLLALKSLAGGKPVLVTSIEARYVAGRLPAEVEQFQFLRRTIQLCYWLDAKVVAYPTALGTDGREAGLRSALVEETEKPGPGGSRERKEGALPPAFSARPGLSLWHELLSWRQVEQLSATIHDPRRPWSPARE